jgi:hypothetical protein
MYGGAIAEGLANKMNWGIVTLVYPPWVKGAFIVEDAPTLKSYAYYKKVFINHACNGINCENRYCLTIIWFVSARSSLASISSCSRSPPTMQNICDKQIIIINFTLEQHHLIVFENYFWATLHLNFGSTLEKWDLWTLVNKYSHLLS